MAFSKMWKFSLPAATCVLYFASALSQSNVVDVGYAKYKGNQTYTNAVAYLGIPYAEPPVGNLRFRAPKTLNTTRVAAGSGGTPIDATKYADFCIQGTTGGV